MNLSIMFGIINLLLKKRSTHAEDIAEKFEISTRSVYRYVDHMNMEGIPIYTQIGRNGGIYLDEKYVIDKTYLTKGELDYLKSVLSENTNTMATQIKNKLNLF